MLGAVRFFFAKIAEVNSQYANLLAVDSEDRQNADESRESESDAGDTDSDTFTGRWGWVHCVDTVSETCRCSWEEVWQKPVMEFFNILAYHNDKVQHDREQRKQWKQQN